MILFQKKRKQLKMKKAIIIFTLILTVTPLCSQNMSLSKLGEILESVSDSIQGQNGQWSFFIDEIPLFCVTAEEANRMRIISPVTESDRLDEEMKTNALLANFHTALDVKYAISDGILWSTFIHPLRELSKDQVIDAISQVYQANRTFGTTYTSTDLTFGGITSGRQANEGEKKEIKKEKF